MKDSPQQIYRKIAQSIRDVGAKAIETLAAADLEPGSWDRVDYSQGQGGTQPRQIDRRVSEIWGRYLRSSDFGSPIVVVGEEDDDESLLKVALGSVICDIDPFDGTSVHASLGVGSSMSVVIYKRVTSGLIYVGVSVIQIARRTHWWAEPTATWRGGLDQPVDRDELVVSPTPGRYRDRGDWTVAGVGAKAGRTRDLLNRLTDAEGIRTVTLGGSPFGPEVLGRELAALVECEDTTVFDSAHLMLAANTDAIVGTLDGNVLEPPMLREHFLSLDYAKDRVVPPYVMAKDLEVYETVIEHVN